MRPGESTPLCCVQPADLPTRGVFYVTMITEVAPAPKMYLFMSLFNMMGKTSAFIGPFISSAIIDRAGGKTNMSYWFLLAMGVLGFIVLCFVDPDKAKVDNAKCRFCSKNEGIG